MARPRDSDAGATERPKMNAPQEPLVQNVVTPFPARRPDRSDPDALIRFAVDRLSLQPDGWRSLVRDLAQLWPATPALELSFVLVSAAETLLAADPRPIGAEAQSRHAYKLAALVALDVYAMQVTGRNADTAADLHRYWTEIDPYFLRL
ncbi:MAG: hypothetical protein ACRCSU_09715 [Paracoccaceae bacterium]